MLRVGPGGDEGHALVGALPDAAARGRDVDRVRARRVDDEVGDAPADVRRAEVGPRPLGRGDLRRLLLGAAEHERRRSPGQPPRAGRASSRRDPRRARPLRLLPLPRGRRRRLAAARRRPRSSPSVSAAIASADSRSCSDPESRSANPAPTATATARTARTMTTSRRLFTLTPLQSAGGVSPLGPSSPALEYLERKR